MKAKLTTNFNAKTSSFTSTPRCQEFKVCPLFASPGPRTINCGWLRGCRWLVEHLHGRRFRSLSLASPPHTPRPPSLTSCVSPTPCAPRMLDFVTNLDFVANSTLRPAGRSRIGRSRNPGRSRNWPKSKMAEVENGRSRKWPKSKLAEVEIGRSRTCTFCCRRVCVANPWLRSMLSSILCAVVKRCGVGVVLMWCCSCCQTGPPGLAHDSPRTPNVHISGPRPFKNTTKIPRKDPKREKEERKLWREEGKKRAKFGPPTLRAPPFGDPPFGAPPFGAPPFGAPPFGAPPFGAPPFDSPPFGAPLFLRLGLHPLGPSPFWAPPFGAPPFRALTLQGPTLLGPTLLGPTLLGPTLLGPTLSGPHPFWAPPFLGPTLSGPHPSGPHPVCSPSLLGPTLLGSTLLLGPTLLGSTLLATLRGSTLLGHPSGLHPLSSQNSTSKNWPKSKSAEVEIGRQSKLTEVEIDRSRNWPKSNWPNSKKRVGRSRNWPKSSALLVSTPFVPSPLCPALCALLHCVFPSSPLPFSLPFPLTFFP